MDGKTDNPTESISLNEKDPQLYFKKPEPAR